ncbi:hypothetical protein N9C75_03640 [Alphaproteobacteria bacterium]|nr:hypothetical protein [Alphaproteobacteria bacterium]
MEKNIIEKTPQEIFDKIGICSDVTNIISPSIKVLYLQNKNDTFHVKKHLEPLLRNGDWQGHSNEIFFERSRGIVVCKTTWGEGHLPPPTRSLLEIIQLIKRETDILGISRFFTN